MPEWFLFKMEIQGFFLHVRSLHFVPLTMVGVFLIVWIYPTASPFVPVVLLVLIGLEPQFNNIFFRTPNELEAMSLFPLSWRRVIVVKNFAAVSLSVIFFLLISMVLFYFSPTFAVGNRLKSIILYFITIVFPLLHTGNTNSLQSPRRESGLQLNDFIEAVRMLITVGILSIPYFLFISLLEMPALCLLYGLGTMVLWYRNSVQRTAERLEKERTKICSSL